MRFLHFFFVVIAVLIASAGRASGSKLTPAISFKYSPTKRLLRADITNGEERVVNIPGFDKISKALTSSKTKELQNRLKADESLGNAFKTLGLSTMPIGKNNFIERKMVAKLLSSRSFQVWSQHAAKINKQDPAGEMLTALTSVFGEKTVAIMIDLGKHSWGSSTVAKQLERAQFDKWYAKNLYLTADDALKNVLKVKRSEIHANPREKFVWEAYSKYILNRVMKY
ncbi:hypothetical protein PPTG_19191 [Phytophthora nicotianae INRA-310]|uniref:RxLR effector protein n=1 Tax=Phytophthora nicotianae (strain INRA-310) TaxID=761204 RepID=W2PFY0_PHYN3|nr:hypothetical protein PPTG_19191 [Phytophthora nicotianae INRA-310]ETM98914.1 hypothetical protein PPTG_19191 [Phytophthora nicotianae INRA-310]